MVVFPNCKINLGLHVLGKRDDGFHNLQTVFYPIKLQDGLEIIQNADNNTSISITGIDVDNDVLENNICIKAYQLLKKDFELPPVNIHLHKGIPIGAGLGGGSADGAFTLLLLNKKFNLQLSEDELISYSLQLGSDCPFFVKNKPYLAKGRGEILEEIALDLSAYKIIVVNPGIHINTGWAFSQLNLNTAHKNLLETINKPVNTWKNNLTNDFEELVFKAHPPIKSCKDELYAKGAVYAAMSGTGSTVFGIFGKEVNPVFHFPNEYFVKEC